jgi:serine/threonine protein kinase
MPSPAKSSPSFITKRRSNQDGRSPRGPLSPRSTHGVYYPPTVILFGSNLVTNMKQLALLDSDFSEDVIQDFVACAFHKYGKVRRRSAGMCGSVYFFDQGENVHPRWVAVKIPRTPKNDRSERNRRFLREMEIQHKTFSHEFVCYPFDYDIIYDTPAGLYRAMDGDLSNWIPDEKFSDVGRLSTLAYLCAALIHCRTRGVLCHQDLKPENILMRNYRPDFIGLPEADIFNIPRLADFGLANMGLDFQHPAGAKPYMAPEQWLTRMANGASDVFSFGVIIFEVMTRGMHPLGERTFEWWPKPLPGNSKKWLREEMWFRWAKDGNPVSSTLSGCDGVDEIARACMSSNPTDRPSFEEVQERLLGVLWGIDKEAFNQANFRISYANGQAGTNDDWPYRDRRLDRLRIALQDH